MANKNLKGTVVATAEKTISVEIERQVRHPLYQKILKRHSKILAHDESSIGKIGDIVEIEECRPMSKKKAWKLKKVVK